MDEIKEIKPDKDILEEEQKNMKIIIVEGISYFKKETIAYYGKCLLRKISGNKHIKELQNGFNKGTKNSGTER